MKHILNPSGLAGKMVCADRKRFCYWYRGVLIIQGRMYVCCVRYWNRWD